MAYEPSFWQVLRIVLLVIIAGVLLVAGKDLSIRGVDWLHARKNASDTHAVRAAPAARTWQEVHRWPLISDSYGLHGYLLWQLKEMVTSTPRIRRRLHVSIASSEPARTLFILTDEVNGQRLMAGYPPLLQASRLAGEGTDFYLDLPPGNHMLGFAEIAPEEQRLTNYSQLAILAYAIQQFQRATRPPIRITAQIENVLDCFCSDTEAAEGKRQLEAASPHPPVN